MNKSFWYVMIMTNQGPVFVTKADRKTNVAEWKNTEAPLAINSKGMAQQIADGLSFNVGPAYAKSRTSHTTTLWGISNGSTRRNDMKETRVCPICGHSYSKPSALSRKDGATYICPDCGTREALASAGLPAELQDLIVAQARRAMKK